MIPEHAEKIHEGIRFDVYRWEEEMHDGSIVPVECVQKIPGVQLIATTPDNKIILLDEHQAGKKPFISLAGGGVEHGEDVKLAGARELLEETGMVAQELSLWKQESIYGFSTYNYYYIAKHCKKVQEQELEPGEKITTFTVSFEEFLDIVEENPKFRNQQFRNIMFRVRHTPGELEQFKKMLFN